MTKIERCAVADFSAPIARGAGGIIGNILSRQRPIGPELSAVVLSEVPIIHPHVRNTKPFSDTGTKLLGHPVSHLHAATVIITNTGREPILAEKYSKPIRIEFESDLSHLLQVTINWRRPGQLDPTDDAVAVDQENDKNGITLRPPIINPGDGFNVQIITAQTEPLGINIQVRYPGVERVEILRFASAETTVQYHNTEVAQKEVSWINGRKFFPAQLKFRRSSQLKELVNQITNWKE